MYESLTPLLFTVVTLPVVLVMQRWIHRHLQGLALLITGSFKWSIIVYAIILFPGVLLHEGSHWLMAQLLGVRTGRFSLWPRQTEDGNLRLGYVEYYKSRDVGAVRESLIGGAPLIFGMGVIVAIGSQVFGASDLAAVVQTGRADALSRVLNQVFATNDFWLWLYLLFAVGNAMMPSPSDRQAWPGFLVVLAVVTGALFVMGVQDVVLQQIDRPLAIVFGYIGMALSMTIAVNLVFMAGLGSLEWMVSRIRGAHVEYNP